LSDGPIALTLLEAYKVFVEMMSLFSWWEMVVLNQGLKFYPFHGITKHGIFFISNYY